MAITTMGWVLCGLGFVPWRVHWRSTRKGQGRGQAWRTLELQALFWQVRVVQGPRRCQWQLTLPLIARCKAAIWSALQTLIKV